MTEQQTPSLIRRNRVEQITAYSKSELYRLIKAGRFPAPLPKEPGERASYWVLSEVLAHVQERIKRRDEQRSEQGQARADGGRFGSGASA